MDEPQIMKIWQIRWKEFLSPYRHVYGDEHTCAQILIPAIYCRKECWQCVTIAARDMGA